MTTEPGITAASQATSSTAVTDSDELMAELEDMSQIEADQPARIKTETDIESTLSIEDDPQSVMQRNTLTEMTEFFCKYGGTGNLFTTVRNRLKGWGRLGNGNVQLAVWQNELGVQLCEHTVGSGYPAFLYESSKLLARCGVSDDELSEGRAVWMEKRGIKQASHVEDAPSGHGLTGPVGRVESTTSPSRYSRSYYQEQHDLFGRRGG